MVEIVEDDFDSAEQMQPKYLSDAIDNYTEFVAKVSEPSDKYKDKFDELQRDLVLANLRKEDEERLINLQILLRDIFAIEEDLKKYDDDVNLNMLKERYLSRFAALVEMTRARKAKTLETLITSRVQHITQQEKQAGFFDKLRGSFRR